MPIFDQGYQHWSGQLAGHAWRWLAITRHGLRVALAGRAIRLLLFVAVLPALVLAFVLAMWGLLEQKSDLITSIMPMFGFLDPAILAGPRAYRVEIWTITYSYFLQTESFFAMILILFVGPNLISQDLRYNALPLYFSRPLRRFDYLLGKLGVIVALLGMVIVVPALAAYALGIVFSLDITILRDTFRILLASVAYGLVISLSAGLLILALSSLSRNSRYVALFWIGMWFVTSAVSTALEAANFEQRIHEVHRAATAGSAGDKLFDEQSAAERDWRPLVSYTANLKRIGQQLLGTNAAWEKLSKLQPENTRAMFLYSVQGPQFPWYWSAAVLAALVGLSLCILNFQIKSLDRLK
jgi:ABC-2 type transport system permease protein